MGSRKTKAMAELIDRIESIVDDIEGDPDFQVTNISYAIGGYRELFFGSKRRAAKEKKKSKAQAKIEEAKRKYTWSWQVPKEVMETISRCLDEEDAAKAEAKAAKAAKRRAKKGGRPA